MSNATRMVGRLMVVVAAVSGAFAQGQPSRGLVQGGMTRNAMYLRLFREIADFEARADAEEAKGATPSTLRNYHQRRLGLSAVRGAQLRDAALECVRGLQAEGLVSEGGASRATGRPERIMERVGAAVDSLAAAMGPAEFAYLDSLVRRWAATPTAQAGRLGLSVAPGGAAEVKSALPSVGELLYKQPPALPQDSTTSCCTKPTGEDSTGTPPAGKPPIPGYAAMMGGPRQMPWGLEFFPFVTPNGSAFAGRYVHESLSADDDSSCRNVDPAGPALEGSNEWGWTLLDKGQYEAGDEFVEGIPWTWYYLNDIFKRPSFNCGAVSSQTMSINCPDGPSIDYTTNDMIFWLWWGEVDITRGNATFALPVQW